MEVKRIDLFDFKVTLDEIRFNQLKLLAEKNNEELTVTLELSVLLGMTELVNRNLDKEM